MLRASIFVFECFVFDTTVETCHGLIANPEIFHNFAVLAKCKGKLDCLMHEMLLVGERHPNLTTQTDSIRAKVLTLNTYHMLNNFSADSNLNT